jgi:NAD(P)-dependent dehydrogenase (short-subunit alcohol dehydrogenase family)
MDPNLLAGGIAVLTGSASGMGLSMAKKCAAMGMNVVISDVRSTAIGQAVADIKVGYPTAGVTGFTCDVSLVV